VGELGAAMVTMEALGAAAAVAGEERRPRKWNGERRAVRAGAGEVQALSVPPWPHAARHQRRAASAGHHVAARL